MIREQEVSFFQKDNRFVDVFPRTKEASRELKNRELVELWPFSENDEGIVNCVSKNQAATGLPVIPIVYGNSDKQNFPVVDVSVDEMNKWKNDIKLHAYVCDLMDGRIFNNHTHWNMRCKFLEFGLRINGMEKIRENPDQIYEKPEGKFFIYTPIRRNKNDKKRNEEAKSIGSCPADYVKKCSQSDCSKSKVCLKVQNVISSDNTTKNFICQMKMNKDCTKEAKTNGFKPYQYVTNGSQSDSSMKNQSIISNFCSKEEDIIPPDNAENNIENIEMKSEILQQEQHSKSETYVRKVDDELVLEDVSDKDLVLPEVVFASPQRLTRSTENAGDEEMSCALAVQQHNVFQNESHPAIERSEVRVSLSKLERLRRGTANFFGRFRRNRVTPVDI